MKLRIVPARAANDLKKLRRKNPDAFQSVKDTLQVVEEVGWGNALRGGQIKLLGKNVGEIRDMGASYRIIFYWKDEQKHERVLYLTSIAKKRSLMSRRLQKLIKRAEKACREHRTS